MTEEVSLLPLALAEVERDIANTDAEIGRLKEEISIREVKKQSLQKTAHGLQELLGMVPRRLIGDRGSRFTSCAVFFLTL